jgi:hypothetical protein
MWTNSIRAIDLDHQDRSDSGLLRSNNGVQITQDHISSGDGHH